MFQKIDKYNVLGFALVMVFGALALVLLARIDPFTSSDVDVVFTKPECDQYAYLKPISAFDGTLLKGPPRHAFCTREDLERNLANPEQPYSRLAGIISSPETEEVFIAASSFHNQSLLEVMCDAAKRGVRFNVVLSKGRALEADSSAQSLLKCSEETENPATLKLIGRNRLGGIQHLKMVLVNPMSSQVKLVFGSGNLSLGLSMHFENWFFAEVPRTSYLAQGHLCLREALLNGDSLEEHASIYEACRPQVSGNPSRGVQLFFTPYEKERAVKQLEEMVQSAKAIDVVAHRISRRPLYKLLIDKLESEPNTIIRLIVDDDFFDWEARRGVRGFISEPEKRLVTKLAQKGVKIRYTQTNLDVPIFQHNKFIVTYQTNDRSLPDRAFSGAGNFTYYGFNKNLENFYAISSIDLVEKFSSHFSYLWDISTSEEKMPTDIIDIRAIKKVDASNY